MQYQSLTQEERDLAIAQALHARETEHFHYDLNIQNYEAMLKEPALAELPKEWPAEVAKYRTLARDAVVAAVSDPVQRALVLSLQQRDRLVHMTACEKHEAANVERIYAALDTQLPPVRKEAALAAAKTAREAERTKP